MKNTKGFTLIELLIVIGIIAILASGVIVAINPGRQFEQARNSTRWQHMNTIANAVYSYAVENNGNLPDCDDGGGTPLSDGDNTERDVSNCVDLTPDYMNEFPSDPSDGENYEIKSEDGSTITLTSTASEADEVTLTK